MKNFTQKLIGLLAIVFVMSFTTNAQNNYLSSGTILETFGNGFELDTEQNTSAQYVSIDGAVYYISFFYCEDDFMFGGDAPCNSLDIYTTNSDGSQGEYIATSPLDIIGLMAYFYANYEQAIVGEGIPYLSSGTILETFGNGFELDTEQNTSAQYVSVDGAVYYISFFYCEDDFMFGGDAPCNSLDIYTTNSDGSQGEYIATSPLDIIGLMAYFYANYEQAIVGEGTPYETTESFLHLPQGWSMFGYTCLDSVDAMVGFSSISDNIEIVKDEWGLTYLPSWDFNAMGSLQFSEGYQIKMLEEVTNFQFCTTITGGASQEELDASYDNGVASVDITSNDADVFAQGAASVTPEDGISQADLDALSESYAGWCASDIDNDGICDVDEVSGCMNASSCNYVSAAEFDDDSCDNVSCLDDCGVINGDNSSCSDCAGVPNGTSEDLGCGCGNPQAQAGYDCEGNAFLQIGDFAHGGIVFQINEDGTGLVSDLQDLGQLNWYDAMDAAASATSQGYDDWFLPSIEELELMYNTIGQGTDNAGGFAEYYYWSSSGYSNQSAYYVYFYNGSKSSNYRYQTYRVRIIRAF